MVFRTASLWFARIKTNLILRSRAQRGVSKDGQHHDWFPPFETRSCGPLLRVRFYLRPARTPAVRTTMTRHFSAELLCVPWRAPGNYPFTAPAVRPDDMYLRKA